MSKAALKKELESFTREQLIQVLLDTYSSSKSAKEYLEFFLNPDAEALRQKKIDLIAKELRREKWGYSKARISHIKQALKDYESFNVGDGAMEQLCLDTFRLLLGTENYLHFQPALMNGTSYVATKLLEHAISNDNAERVLANINTALNTLASKHMKSVVSFNINNFLEDHKSDLRLKS